MPARVAASGSMAIVSSEVAELGCSAPILRGVGTGRPAPLDPDRHNSHATITTAVIATTAMIETIAVRFVLRLVERSTTFPESDFTLTPESGVPKLPSSGFSSVVLLIS
jgi:hypothetical protein